MKPDQLLRAILPEVLIDNFDIERFEKRGQRIFSAHGNFFSENPVAIDGYAAVTPVKVICISSDIIRIFSLCVRSDWRGGVHAAHSANIRSVISRDERIFPSHGNF